MDVGGIFLACFLALCLRRCCVSAETCEFEDVSVMPASYSDSCTEIVIDDHTISQLRSDELAALPASCAQFRISNGVLESISADAFASTTLTEVDLQKNELSFVPQLSVSDISGSMFTSYTCTCICVHVPR